MIRTAQRTHRAIRRKLLISCATFAIATAALAPQKARASGGAHRCVPGDDRVDQRRVPDVDADRNRDDHRDVATATINWSPTDTAKQFGKIVFLPNGNVATFQGSTDASDYTVLNRVLPDGAYPIELNGTVQSFISGGATGGRIWFYSPGGISSEAMLCSTSVACCLRPRTREKVGPPTVTTSVSRREPLRQAPRSWLQWGQNQRSQEGQLHCTDRSAHRTGR